MNAIRHKLAYRLKRFMLRTSGDANASFVVFVYECDSAQVSV